jgi:hypothetical protein
VQFGLVHREELRVICRSPSDVRTVKRKRIRGTREDKECTQNFDGETSCEMFPWQTEKELGG